MKYCLILMRDKVSKSKSCGRPSLIRGFQIPCGIGQKFVHIYNVENLLELWNATRGLSVKNHMVWRGQNTTAD